MKRSFGISIALMKQGLFVFVITAVFFLLRAQFHARGKYAFIWIATVSYGIAMVSAGLRFGRIYREYSFSPKAGLMFSFMVYILFHAIWIGFMVSGVSTPGDSAGRVASVMFFWGIGIVFYAWYAMKHSKTIRRMDIREIFD
jgi:hypothetical protein